MPNHHFGDRTDMIASPTPAEILARVERIERNADSAWDAVAREYTRTELSYDNYRFLVDQLRAALQDVQRVEPIIEAAQELDEAKGMAATWNLSQSLKCAVRNYFATLSSPEGASR